MVENELNVDWSNVLLLWPFVIDDFDAHHFHCSMVIEAAQ
jgi:hypothetical protein